MGQVKATFDGAIVAELEVKEFSSGASVLEFPVYVADEQKNRDTQEYEKTGDTTKIRVKIWSSNPIYGEVLDTVQKGDIVEVVGTLKEREFEGKNGKGRALETKWVESVVVKYRKDGASTPSSLGAGFDDDDATGF